MVWYAFGDESESATYFTVNGFIASPRQWKLLRTAWRGVLDREGVTTFHAEEFFQRANWLSAKSPYYGWDNTPGRSDAFINDLIEVVRVRDIRPIGGPLKVADFFDMHPDARKMISGESVRWNFEWVPGSEDDPAVKADARGL